MKKVKRSVALLLVVCFLFTGTAFAEGDIASGDAVSEEIRSEEPVSGDEASKEAVPEGPAAEDTLPENVPTQEPSAEDTKQSDSKKKPEADTRQIDNKNELTENVQPVLPEKKREDGADSEDLQKDIANGEIADDGSGAELAEGNAESDLTKSGILSIEVDESDKENGKIRILIHDVTSGEPVEHILVSVWSEMNGQDDLKEYEAENDGNGNYVVELDIKEHNYSYGKYIIHAYIREHSGEQYLAGESDSGGDQRRL